MKEILNLNDLNPFFNIYKKDKNKREINLYKITNVQFYFGKTFYPNVIVNSNEGIIRPINEKIMSLKNTTFNDKNLNLTKVSETDNTPYFFLIYNTDNYYHFIYDTVPYLISFFELKKKLPDLKLLINYPNHQKKSHYKFVIELLNILSITEKDIKIVNDSINYSNIYISNSYTHGINSNLPPRKEIYDLYDKIVDTVKKNNDNDNLVLPKKIYISRRSWVNGDTSNIGTNYTTKRKLVNEDDVVEFLTSIGFVEVFSESLTTEEKILLFNSAEHIVGPIGGGLVNSIFCKESTKLDVLLSPTFLDVNERFLFSFEKVNYNILDISSHVDKGLIKKYMRVKFEGKVGEVIDINDNIIKIIYSDYDVAGWNNEINYNEVEKVVNDVKPIDDGLNSEWKINIKKLKSYIC